MLNKKYIITGILTMIIIASIVVYSGCVKYDEEPYVELPNLAKAFYLAGYPGDIKVKDFTTGEVITLVSSNAGNFDVSNNGRKMVFASNQTGKWQIYVGDINNNRLSNIHMISDGVSRCEDPRFFWDGRKIVYKRNNDIIISDINGNIIQEVTNTPDIEEWSPAVAPDGAIAFVRGHTEIVLWRNGEEEVITSGLNCSYRREFFYPVFRYDGALFFVGKCKDYEDDIYYLPPNSTRIKRLYVNEQGVSDADPYPVFGTNRWLAFNSLRGNGELRYEGYIADLTTNKVFKIISDTKSVLNPIVILNSDGNNFPFAITSGYYSENDNLESAVRNELGDDYTIADWNEVKSWCNSHSAEEFINNLNWEWGENNSLMVTRNGEHFWSGTNRHYYITRWDHNVPGYYLVHDDIENGYITLGSWYNLHMRILGVRRSKQ